MLGGWERVCSGVMGGEGDGGASRFSQKTVPSAGRLRPPSLQGAPSPFCRREGDMKDWDIRLDAGAGEAGARPRLRDGHTSVTSSSQVSCLSRGSSLCPHASEQHRGRVTVPLFSFSATFTRSHQSLVFQ